jgi:DNA-binding MarR family transcriptional regulator
LTASARRYAEVGEREALRAQVSDLFLSFFERLHASPVDRWLELDLTMPQLKMLFVVDLLGPVPMGQLAARLGISLPTATGLIDRLVEAGLARREHDERDRRVVLVGTTAEGLALIVRLRSANGERLGRVLGHLGVDELRCCARALESMNVAAQAELDSDQRFPAAVAAGCAEAGK